MTLAFVCAAILRQERRRFGQVVEDAHGDAHVEALIGIRLHEVFATELAVVGDPLSGRLLLGEGQHVGREVDAHHAPRAAAGEVGGVHARPAADVEDVLARDGPRRGERDFVALEDRLAEDLVEAP